MESSRDSGAFGRILGRLLGDTGYSGKAETDAQKAQEQADAQKVKNVAARQTEEAAALKQQEEDVTNMTAENEAVKQLQTMEAHHERTVSFSDHLPTLNDKYLP